MTLRRRISFIAAGAVAIAVCLALLTGYFVVRNQLFAQIDNSLRAQAGQKLPNNSKLSSQLPGLSASAGGSAPYAQEIRQDGTVIASEENDTVSNSRILPVTESTLAIAAGTAGAQMTTVTVSGVRLRVYTYATLGSLCLTCVKFPVALQLARPLGSTEHILRRMRQVFAAVFLLVVLLAAIVARLATHRVLSPLGEVTSTAESIGETGDLERRLVIRRNDEVGQLARRFNEMLERLSTSRAELDESVGAQRQLVADASHELRTPVTSLRTNAEILMESGNQLDEEDRKRLLEDVVEQTEELSTLVADLIEVGRGELPDAALDDERLDDLVEEALARARRNSPQTIFIEQLEPVMVRGNPERLTRAINNLLDNAARHTDPGTEVEVTLDESGLTVRDHGQGIDETDLPHIFDRFYRGASSRGKQGSGLGLAIVHQVTEQHQGQVSAANAPDGGAVFKLTLPTLPLPGPDGADESTGAGEPTESAAPDDESASAKRADAQSPT